MPVSASRSGESPARSHAPREQSVNTYSSRRGCAAVASSLRAEAIAPGSVCCGAAGERRPIRASAAAGDGAKAAGSPEVSTTATVLAGGSVPKRTRAMAVACSSRVRLPSRRAIRGAVSNTNAAATGASVSASQPAPFSTGRDRAAARSTRAAMRTTSSRMWRSRSRRRFATARSWSSRSAGKMCGTGRRRIARWSTMGTATRAAPPRSAGVRKERPMTDGNPRRAVRSGCDG